VLPGPTGTTVSVIRATLGLEVTEEAADDVPGTGRTVTVDMETARVMWVVKVLRMVVVSSSSLLDGAEVA